MKECKACGQPVPAELVAERKRMQYVKQKQSIKRRKEIGLNVGRPREVNRQDVTELRERGLSIRQIAKKLECSTWPVHKIIKEWKP